MSEVNKICGRNEVHGRVMTGKLRTRTQSLEERVPGGDRTEEGLPFSTRTQWTEAQEMPNGIKARVRHGLGNGDLLKSCTQSSECQPKPLLKRHSSHAPTSPGIIKQPKPRTNKTPNEQPKKRAFSLEKLNGSRNILLKWHLDVPSVTATPQPEAKQVHVHRTPGLMF